MEPDSSPLQVLRRQELSRYYRRRDYLSAAAVTSQAASTRTISPLIRAEILKWVFDITFYLKLDSNLGILTATLLDCALSTEKGSCSLSSITDFRLATMACFYLTAKMHDNHSIYNKCRQNGKNPAIVAVTSKLMSTLSHGYFTAEEVEMMELVLLQALDWHMNPPTVLDFVQEFLAVIPCSVSSSTKGDAYELCCSQIQHCCLEYRIFALTEASTLACAALQNAFASLGMDSVLIRHVVDICSYAAHADLGRNSPGLHGNLRMEATLRHALAPMLPTIGKATTNLHQLNKRRKPKAVRSFPESLVKTRDSGSVCGVQAKKQPNEISSYDFLADRRMFHF